LAVPPVLILDFDGTVLDTELPAYRAAAELWEAHGVELTIEMWSARIGTHARLDPFRELEELLGRRTACR
jgi:beta-phosphoglucomutase-like phosphatase (HAD superfamily)